MSGNYWRMVFIQPSPPESGQCVMLYGEMDEIVGPMTVELAEAWIDRFDNQLCATAEHAPSRGERQRSASTAGA